MMQTAREKHSRRVGDCFLALQYTLRTAFEDKKGLSEVPMQV